MTMPAPLPCSNQERIVDELARQHGILVREKWQRIVLTSFAYALCALFVSPLAIAALLVIDILAELESLRLLRGLDPVTDRSRYRASLLAVVLMEAAFATAAGLVWLEDDPYAKALAAGLAMTTLLQLSTVRAIHLPYGLAGMLTVGVIVCGFNLGHWVGKDNLPGLALSMAAALGGISYALTAMVSNNGLHRASAAAAAAARASDAAKGLFLAQMSHELRTPLNAIIGLGEVEAAAASGPSRDRLRTLVSSARGLAVVLDDVLDLSALSDGRVSITPKATGLQALLEAAVGAFRTEAAKAGIGLVLTLPKDLPAFVHIDAQRLRQCLSNLVGNALKHGGGEVRVTVRLAEGLLTIEVADDGPGVPPAFAEQLFQPFHRARPDVPGLGLGLSISRSLARRMGGDLELVTSDSGAVFRLVIAAPVASPPPVPVAVDLTGRRILVVDDIATNRLVAASLVQSLGGSVVQASSGSEALRCLTEAPFDLVLLDMAMPGMDGFETFRQLRAAPAGAVPVVAMTAGATADQRAAVQAAGLDGFLAKPLLPDALAEVFGPLLTRKGA